MNPLENLLLRYKNLVYSWVMLSASLISPVLADWIIFSLQLLMYP